MIDEIHVRNLALIRDGEIAPASGMTAITGETGAGKTALLASCKLIMGSRADRGLIREGEPAAEVQARLFLPSVAGAGASEESEGAGEAASSRGDISDTAPADSDAISATNADCATASATTAERELVITRRLTSDGRSHVKINGALASVAELASLVAPTIDLCSQHDHQALAKPQAQRRLVDLWSGSTRGPLEAYQRAYAARREAQSALDELTGAREASEARLDDARLALKKIDALNPSQSDYDELMAALKKAEHAEVLARVTSEAHDALSGEGGALDCLNGALSLVEEGERSDPLLSAQAQALKDALFTAEDVARDLSSYRATVDLDAGELDLMQERALAYQGLMRAFGPTLADVTAKADECRHLLSVYDDYDCALRRANERCAQAEEALEEAASSLHQCRDQGAPLLVEEANEVLARLEMGGAALGCEVEMRARSEWGPDGPDEVRLSYRPGPGMQFRPLARIASGGELSRVLLALHAVMGERDATPTLVFDEIDAGVGGATALALGEVLAGLAQTHQVIVVTHLAQIAAKAQKHYVVRKDQAKGQPSTSIACLSGDERQRELARMLSGAITDASLEHARELLEL